MIIATAGHVDHGKTSLVRALTGIDTDRLAEEKRRGMSIDLGFAYADFGLAQAIGFVDVPGHERFVRNMLAGVGSVDSALIVVAADDGPMPQTLEHVAILDTLGIVSAVVALTKIDRVDPDRVTQVGAEVQALLANTGMQQAAMFPVVASTGEGCEALRAHLVDLARARDRRLSAGLDGLQHSPQGYFRLSVDRAFLLPGAGIVVSGAVQSGKVEVGDQVLISPGGIEARIRSLHAQNQPAQAAFAGQRCALNLVGAGLGKDSVGRGDWIVSPPLHAPTRHLDVRVKLLAGEPLLKDGAMVQVHLSAASVAARIGLLQSKSLAAGQQAWARLVLDQPLAALRGDRFVLRDQAAQRTLGGGRVIDPFGPERGRAKPARLLELEAMSCDDAPQALQQLLALRPDGLDLASFARSWNLDDQQQAHLRKGPGLRIVRIKGADLAVSESSWNALGVEILDTVATHHQQHKDRTGLAESELLAGVPPSRREIRRAAARALLDTGQLVRDGMMIRLPDHQAVLTQKDQIMLERIQAKLQGTGLRPPIVGELATVLDVDPAALLVILQAFSQRGYLAAVASNRFYLPETIAKLVQIARDLADESPATGFDAAAFRDRSGIGRNSTIQVLEFLDRQGFTRFARNRRWMADPDDRSGN